MERAEELNKVVKEVVDNSSPSLIYQAFLSELEQVLERKRHLIQPPLEVQLRTLGYARAVVGLRLDAADQSFWGRSACNHLKKSALVIRNFHNPEIQKARVRNVTDYQENEMIANLHRDRGHHLVAVWKVTNRKLYLFDARICFDQAQNLANLSHSVADLARLEYFSVNLGLRQPVKFESFNNLYQQLVERGYTEGDWKKVALASLLYYQNVTKTDPKSRRDNEQAKALSNIRKADSCLGTKTELPKPSGVRFISPVRAFRRLRLQRDLSPLSITLPVR